MGYRRRLRPVLAARQLPPGLEALHPGTLGLLRRMRLVLGQRRAVRMGLLSLRAVDFAARVRMVLGAGTNLGTGVGCLATRRRLVRLGAVASRLARPPG